MRINHLTQIVRHMYKKIICPQCKTSFQGEAMDVKYFDGKQIVCGAKCIGCRSKITIKANIQTNTIHKTPTHKDLQHKITQKSEKELSPESVKNIMKDLEDFSSSDISDLFL